MDKTDKQLEEVFRRSAMIKKSAPFRRRAIYSGVSFVLCTAFFIPLICLLPDNTSAIPDLFGKRYGSLILSEPYMGYIMIAALSFIMGISFALMCIDIREMRKCTTK